MKVLILGGGGIANGIYQCLENCGVEVATRADFDATDLHSTSELIRNSGANVVINCAGVSYVHKIQGASMVRILEEIHVNLLGSFNVAHAAANYLENPTMIFMGSVAGKYGKPNHGGYCATKAGVISLVQSLAMEGYDAYAISPGRVDTPMREHDYPGEDRRTRLDPEQIGDLVLEILEGKYEPGDNLIIRKVGYDTPPIKVDKGEPWKKELKVGEPPAI